MDYNQAALDLHAKGPGKLTVQSLVSCKDKDALSTAYTPGVAEPCRCIKADPDAVYTYTLKGRTVAVVTNGTAVLGLGDIGPEAGLPVMEGKCVLFKEFGGVDAFPICLNARTKEAVVAAVKAIAPTFGGINLEDIRSPECFAIEEELERELDIPVFHDDQHGTAIIVLAGVLNALKVVGKRIEDVRIVQNGPGCKTAPARPARPSSTCCKRQGPSISLPSMSTASWCRAAPRAWPATRRNWPRKPTPNACTAAWPRPSAARISSSAPRWPAL